MPIQRDCRYDTTIKLFFISLCFIPLIISHVRQEEYDRNFDCLEGQFRMLDKFPFIVGCMGNADWQVPGGEGWEGACMVKKSGTHFVLFPIKKEMSGCL